MKKTILSLSFFAAAFATTADAQEKININGNIFNTADIESITYETLYNQLPDMLDNDSRYSIFSEALKLTGLADSLWIYNKNKSYTVTDRYDHNYQICYSPTSCQVKHTIFAESDETFRKAGIMSVNDLIAYCKQKYANASQWYDYLKEMNISVSTSSDYTNRFNALNMFIAYHIINIGAPVNELVYEKNSKTAKHWNYCFGYEPNNYFETMLPHTIMKVWEINPLAENPDDRTLFINRWRSNNTLTDEYGTMGSESTHPVLFNGVGINRTQGNSLAAINGWIHEINDLLLYDANTVASQQERMRFETSAMLPELYNNGLVNATVEEMSHLNDGGYGARVIMPMDYFDNLRTYRQDFKVMNYTKEAWRALNSDQIGFAGMYDFAIRLMPVATGEYEIRFCYPPMSRGGVVQCYIGTSPDSLSMVPLGEPFDMCEDPTEKGNSMGCVLIWDESAYSSYYCDNYDYCEDFGIESDSIMRRRGYMRAPACYSRGSYNDKTEKLVYDPNDIYSAAKEIVGKCNCRSEWTYGMMMLRKIIGTLELNQSKDYWLRIKLIKAPNDEPSLGAGNLDFIEIVPKSVYDNKTMMEDWY